MAAGVTCFGRRIFYSEWFDKLFLIHDSYLCSTISVDSLVQQSHFGEIFFWFSFKKNCTEVQLQGTFKNRQWYLFYRFLKMLTKCHKCSPWYAHSPKSSFGLAIANTHLHKYHTDFLCFKKCTGKKKSLISYINTCIQFVWVCSTKRSYAMFVIKGQHTKL